MHKSVLLLTLFFVFAHCKAQYYYTDVVSLKASNSTYIKYKKNNIQQITAASIASDNTPTTGFVFMKTIKDGASQIVTHTELEAAGRSDDIEKYSNGRLVKSQDSSDNILTIVDYTYDNEGKISIVKTQTDDTAMNAHNTELHKWFYTGTVPDSMLRIKDNNDTTFIHFKKDESNNIIEELWRKKGRTAEHYFYYYNDKNQLTDIVRFNTIAQQMLPDFLFEYDDKGVLLQLTQIPQGSSDYIIWRYIYDDRGLKTKDILFNKRRELLGTVNYTYR